MYMDITFKMENDEVFMWRTCALIVRGGKLLLLRDSPEGHWYLPGGRVRFGETVEDAALREVEEELGIQVKLLRPLWLNQAFYTGQEWGNQVHELCLYFLTEPAMFVPDKESFFVAEGSQMREARWLSFEEVPRENVYPLFLREKILDLPAHMILLTEHE